MLSDVDNPLVGAWGAAATGAGGDSTTRWAFVPLKPNPLTPAIRRPATAGHGVGAVGTVTGNAGHGIRGLGSW